MSVSPQDLDLQLLQPGTTYCVQINCCAVVGDFTAVFLGWSRDAADESADDAPPHCYTRWSNGVRLHGWAYGVQPA